MLVRRIMAAATQVLVSLMVVSLACAAAAPTSNWPQFRGPNCSGTSADAIPPLQISPTNNILWKIDVPWSPSSPCVWADRIFLTTFTEGELQTRCYDRGTGRLLWARGVKPDKLETFHRTDGSPAAATPATDGQRVVSYFGSFGLLCYDFKGEELWRHPLPVALSGGGFGSGTSPIIVRNRIFLNRDQDENSSLLAVDLGTGKTVWETARPDATGGFGTPIIWKDEGVDEVVLPGSVRLKAYDFKTGQERWVVEGVASFTCTTPVVGDGLLFFGAWSPGKSDAPFPSWESFLARHDKNHDGELTLDEFDPAERDFVRGMDRNRDGKITKSDLDQIQAGIAKSENVLLAVNPGGRGDITHTHIAWKATRGIPYVPSPLYYNGRVYLIRDGGMMSSLDARTGKQFYLQERLEATDTYYSSPVAADGRIYLASLPGRLTVVKAGGDAPEILYQSNFGERIFATPALVGTNLYLRTQTKLYAFGNGKAALDPVVKLRPAIAVSEAEHDFQNLFSDAALKQWRQCGPGRFNVTNAVATGEGGMGLWWYAGSQFTNFVLRGEFVQEQEIADSGVFLRFPDPKNDPWNAVHQGHEMEIGDPDPKDPTWRTGSIYPFKASSKANTKPLGEWNNYEITCLGQNYSVRINGELVTTWTDPQHRTVSGYIGLQNYNDGKTVRHRNLRIKELPGPS